MEVAPPVRGILETPVYVDDLKEAYRFYHGVLGFPRMLDGERINAYDLGPAQVLIVCQRGSCDADALVAGSVVPGHRMDGVGHFAFRIDEKLLADWIAYLTKVGVAIESHVHWPQGGESIYFRDPFDNVVELATAGIWPNDARVTETSG